MTMKTSKSVVVLSALAIGLLLGLAGCANQKEPAEQALAGIEKTLEESGAQIQKYLPERYAEIMPELTSLRDSFAQEKYGDVVTEAPAIAEELRRLVADSAHPAGPAQGRNGGRMGRAGQVHARDDHRNGQEDRRPRPAGRRRAWIARRWKALIADLRRGPEFLEQGLAGNRFARTSRRRS